MKPSQKYCGNAKLLREVSYLKREIDELRENGAEMLRRLGNIEPKANRTYNFRWDSTSSIARRLRGA